MLLFVIIELGSGIKQHILFEYQYYARVGDL